MIVQPHEYATFVYKYETTIYPEGTMIKLVVFDMAGTTVKDEHEVEACFAKASKAVGLDVTDEEILAVQGWSKKFVFEHFWSRQIGRDHAEFEDKVDTSYALFKNILEDYYRSATIVGTDGVLDTFHFLSERGIKIALTTGFYRKVADIILERLGWLKGLDSNYMGGEDALINLSIASDEVENGRPHPDMILKAMKMLNVEDAKQVVNIGDTPSDLEAGVNAGCLLSLGVTNGTHTRAQLEATGRGTLIGGLVELPAQLESHMQPVLNG